MLKEVIITHRDSCKTYPLKRVGLSDLINWENDTPTIKDLCELDMFEHLDNPEIGCILVWRGTSEDATKGYFYPMKITKTANIISIKCYDYGHCGVYEENEMVSDCTDNEGGKILRLREYKDLPSPDYILKLKPKQI